MPPNSTGIRDEGRPARPPLGLWLGILALAVPLVTGLLFSWHSLGDLDIWFHLRAGNDILDGQGLSTVNRYSFAEPDHPWVNHEWLFQIVTALTGPDTAAAPVPGSAPAVATWNLLRSILTGLLLVVVLFGDRGTARLRGDASLPGAAWTGLSVMGGLMLLWPRLTLRPELISYLFLVLLIRNAEQFFRMAPAGLRTSVATEPLRPWLAAVDPRRPAGRIFWITLLWAQFHGFASLSPLLLALCLVLAPVQKRLFRKAAPPPDPGPGTRRAVALVALALLALAVTPNGWHGLLMPVRALTQFSQDQVDLRTTISELVPLPLSPNSLGLTITLFKVSLLWGLLWIALTLGRISLLRICVFGLAAAAAWTTQRSIGLYGLAFMLLHTGTGAGPWRIPLRKNWPTASPTLLTLLGASATVLAAGLLWPQIVQDDFYLREGVARRFGSGTNPARYPVAAAATLGSFEGRPFFANLDAAAFLLAHTSGRIFIDGRTEAYSADLWAEYLDIKRADERSLNLLASRRVEAVCLVTGGGSFDRLAAALLASKDWDLVTAEDAGLLFQPAGGTLNGPATAEKRALILAAEQTLTAAANKSPTRQADLCLAAGQLYGFAGEEKGREIAYRQGLSQRKDHPTLNHNLGNILMARQEYLPALSHFQSALRMNVRLAGSALNAGVCQMRLGLPQDAERSFRRAAAIDPDRPEAWVNLAAARIATGDRAGAAGALEKALDLRPHDVRLQQKLRELRRGTG